MAAGGAIVAGAGVLALLALARGPARAPLARVDTRTLPGAVDVTGLQPGGIRAPTWLLEGQAAATAAEAARTAAADARAYNDRLARIKRQRGGTYLLASQTPVCPAELWTGSVMAMAQHPDVVVQLPPRHYARGRRILSQGRVAGVYVTTPAGRVPGDQLIPTSWEDPRSVLCQATALAGEAVGRQLGSEALVDAMLAKQAAYQGRRGNPDVQQPITDLTTNRRDRQPLGRQVLLGLLPYLKPSTWAALLAQASSSSRGWDGRYVGELLDLAAIAQAADWSAAYGYSEVAYAQWWAEQERIKVCLRDLDNNPETCGVQEGLYFFMQLVVMPAAAVVSAII